MSTDVILGLSGLVLTFVVAPAVVVIRKVYQIGDQVTEIMKNHLPHIEEDIRELRQEIRDLRG